MGLTLVYIGVAVLARPPRLAPALMGVPDVDADERQRAAMARADVVASSAAQLHLKTTCGDGVDRIVNASQYVARHERWTP